MSKPKPFEPHTPVVFPHLTTSGEVACRGRAVGLFCFLFFFSPLVFASTKSITGLASWYSTEACRFNPDPKCPTASGRSLYELEKEKVKFAASWDFSFGTKVKVCNTKNLKCTRVMINDRGPAKKLHRLIDLSRNAFREIADSKIGLIHVFVEKEV